MLMGRWSALAGFYGGWVDAVLTARGPWAIRQFSCSPSSRWIGRAVIAAGVHDGGSADRRAHGGDRRMGVARPSGEILSLKEREFVLAARVWGLRPTRDDEAPHSNAMGPVLVSATSGSEGPS